MKLSAICADITTIEADVIVNAANKTLLGGGSVDGAIHRAAGPELLEACRELGGARTGQVKFTHAFRLRAQYIAHAVGPVWEGGNNGEEVALSACYYRAIRGAFERECTSIAFPCISTGVYGFPFELAAELAVDAAMDWDEKDNPIAGNMDVIFCCFTEKERAHYQKLIDKVMS
ncbi:COG2110 Predicted phosphatase homologous to the C-terminal domain of histone macroH2A1 [uncultured Caudovirales phage]|uniref:COG2110 Predicted phosphatase homologous to the C-terminal domain of histone macroH2A1 n=1 Tax=uncultured Caudovirales phage TaxID=2100421 RepID=A0A6J5L2I5_9CAUD|nr:COG2110 Predicted phosphatase homologous to the C-terminal domain of histone macroH2A1 [uncultured Caudovirales phage]